MNPDSFLEDNISKNPALDLLQKMGYIYISPKECNIQRDSLYNVVLKDTLRNQLKKLNKFIFGNVEHEFSSANIEKAIDDINEPLTDGLIKTSEKIYDALLLGKSYQEILENGKIQSFNIKYIDWNNIENNVFHVTEEYQVESVDKEHNVRPDIVLFINGIPFAVVECKASDISVEQAIEQTIRNQKPEYIPQLFKFVQIVMATNKNSVKYATTKTSKKFWTVWKEDDKQFLEKALSKYITNRIPTEQDKNFISLFSKERIMELIRYFILFDANIKKICRYQQYFAIKEIIKTINEKDFYGNRQSGVIWHTQGSGKSLTMVMLAKYILMELYEFNPKVIIVTDRKELDGQITKTFAHTRLNPARATSGKHLIELIKNNKADIITSIINKFNTVENSGLKSEDKNIFVLVDESHRSNYGELATKMRSVFPNACYIGFTGTPLMKKEKNTMTKFGGKLIHKYTIKDGVEDKAIVPLIYESRFVEQKVDEENIDLWFDETTKRLTDKQKQDLKNKWSSIKKLASTDSRIKRIALDINKHFVEGFKATGFKAMLACNFKKDAVRYLECFEKMGDLKCAVVISAPDMREGDYDVDESTDNKVKLFWQKMMNQYGSAERYEEAIKNRFIDGEIDVLIVCSKLLTGFDAPICQVLYIDKELKEHGLLQAIARTNRLMDGKDYGLIVDYRGLIEKLDNAMNMYSGSGLELFDGEDLKGAINDVISSIGNLKDSYSNIIELFSNINNSDIEELETFLAADEVREKFYELLCSFGKNLNLVINSEIAYNAIEKNELIKYKKAFIFWQKLRRSVKIRYFDAIDNKEYEPLMQNLLDSHMYVAGLKQITNPIDILNKEDFEKEINELVSKKAQADAIYSRITKSISQKYSENPAYYDSFSEKIKATLQEYKDRVINDAEYLEKMRSIMENYAKGKSTVKYPERIKGNIHAQAFYGVISALISNEVDSDFIAEISLEITKIIEKHSMVDWTNNKSIHDRIAQDIDDLFYKYEKERGLILSFDTIDKIIENVKTVALRRF